MNTAQRMLLGISLGDALGAGYEFLKGGRREIARQFTFERFRAHQLGGIPAGGYTDDTQMSIAVAETLLEDPRPGEALFAQRFVTAYHRDPIDGYGKRVRRLLAESSDASEFLAHPARFEFSTGNGTAMRAVPIGVLPNLDAVVDVAVTNARLTHDNPEAIAASVAIALLSHNLYHHGTFSYEPLRPHIKAIDAGSDEHYLACASLWREEPELLFGPGRENKGVPCDAKRTVGAVIYLLENYAGAHVLKQAILLGGDTDSTASIANGLAAMRDGIAPQALALVPELRNNRYGLDYLLELGRRLGEKYPSTGQAR